MKLSLKELSPEETLSWRNSLLMKLAPEETLSWRNSVPKKFAPDETRSWRNSFLKKLSPEEIRSWWNLLLKKLSPEETLSWRNSLLMKLAPEGTLSWRNSLLKKLSPEEEEFSVRNIDVLMNVQSPHKWWSTLKVASTRGLFSLKVGLPAVERCSSVGKTSKQSVCRHVGCWTLQSDCSARNCQ